MEMDEFVIADSISSTSTEVCLGLVRWVPLSMMQAHRKKLQQLFQICRYKDGRIIEAVQEWRDVPDAHE
jgi:hypothetical protein